MPFTAFSLGGGTKGDKTMRLILTAAVLCCTAMLCSSVVVAEISLDTVLKDCEQKTLVYRRDEKGNAVKVGERISGYCKGVLEGVFAILVRTGTICVKEDDSASPDFLLSTVLTYRNETKSQNNDAATVLEAAFKRAFSCAR
jgi:hypothetical protein